MTDINKTRVRYGRVDKQYGFQLATTAPEDDGPIWMVNLMSYRARADYADGRTADISGREADDAYAPLGPLKAIGAQVVFLADVETQLLGDSPKWDRVGIVKYPTRRSFIEMQTRQDFQELHHHKEAGMAETIVAGCLPMAQPAVPADAPEWAGHPHPPTAEDPPVVLLHVLKFPDPGQVATSPTGADHAAEVAVGHGARVVAWMKVEGTIMGDGRSWDQMRFEAFPSKAACMAAALDPAQQRAQADHGGAGADTYSLILRPSIDRLRESLG